MPARAAAAARTADLSLLAKTADTIRGLSADGVQRANSGHPGMPMGTAEMATVLFDAFITHDPADPQWQERDRFVLSAGHGSMLLYSVLHLCGGLELEELKNFRQWGSKTPGHPEYGHTPGVDVTTGPLGTGFASGVGMAIAERSLAARYNREGHEIIDHMTWGIVSDGDLMEGVASEAASLAGHLGLGKLVYLYDDNSITIDGTTDLAFGENVGARFEAYGWQVQVVDGHDLEALREAVEKARAEADKPSLICCRTTIGKGSPNKAGTSASHGAPLGEEELGKTKAALGLPEEAFHVPGTVAQHFAGRREIWAAARAQWLKAFEAYKAEHPELAAELEANWAGTLPAELTASLPKFEDGAMIATRDAGQKVLDALEPILTTLIGGSADLAGSNKTVLKQSSSFSRENPGGRNLHFGVREHAMSAICNGIALHGGLHIFDATFLVFSDFMRGGVRLSALMGLPVVHVFSHDSFYLGEDGPTHQPIEHLASLRAMPNLHVFRPADARETAAAWEYALRRRGGPTAICTSRQKLPVLPATKGDVERGAYVAHDPQGEPDGILIATGSELSLAMEAAEQLQTKGRAIRVVSMPCWEAFEVQDAEYRESILPAALGRRMSVEAGTSFGWARYAQVQHAIDHFGASAPAGVLAKEFGFSVDALVAHYLESFPGA